QQRIRYQRRTTLITTFRTPLYQYATSGTHHFLFLVNSKTEHSSSARTLPRLVRLRQANKCKEIVKGSKNHGICQQRFHRQIKTSNRNNKGRLRGPYPSNHSSQTA